MQSGTSQESDELTAKLPATRPGPRRPKKTGGASAPVADPLARVQVHRPMGRRATSGLKCCVMSNALPPRVMKRDPAGHQGVPRLSTSARTKLLVSLGAAIVGGAAAAAVGAGRSAPLIGWDILAVVFCAWVWIRREIHSEPRPAREPRPRSG